MLILCIFLCIACYFDYRQSRIPNWLVAAAFLFRIGMAFLEGGVSSAIGSLTSVLIVTALFYPLFRIGTLGAGDVKLFGVCAGYLPCDKILWFLFFSLFFAAGISLIRFAKEPDRKERFRYLLEYLREVAESGKWRLYIEDEREQKRVGICLAGPVLLSILMYIGGLY